MHIHAAMIGHQTLQLPYAKVNLTAAVKLFAPIDVQEGGTVAQIHHAHILLLRAGAAVIGPQQTAVGTFAGGEYLQLKAGTVQHGPVTLHGFFQRGAGKQAHFGGIAIFIPGDPAHGVVKEIAALLLGEIVPEFIGQVIAQLLLGHGGHDQIPGEHLGGRQHQRSICQGNGVFPGRPAQEVRHGVHRKNLRPGHHVVRQLCRDSLFHLSSGEIGQLDAAFANVDANNLFQSPRPHFLLRRFLIIQAGSHTSLQRVCRTERPATRPVRCWAPTGSEPLYFYAGPRRPR